MRKLIMALVLSVVPLTSFADDLSAAKALDEVVVRIRNEYHDYQIDNDSQALFKELKNLEPVAEEAKKYCKQDPESRSCLELGISKTTVVPIVESLELDAKENDRASSSEGMIEDACDATRQIKQLNGIIAHEKEVGKISGFVNATNLHTAGSALVEQKSRLASIITAYKAKTKKDLKIGACK